MFANLLLLFFINYYQIYHVLSHFNFHRSNILFKGLYKLSFAEFNFIVK